MARTKSLDKRNSILEAATRVFAESGLGAPTSAISKAAEVGEGTLFTYFETKDALINALYREIKMQLADAMMTGFERKKSVRSKLEHVWNRYVDWGLANPFQFRALRHLGTWTGLTEESKRVGSVPFAAMEAMMREAQEQKIVEGIPRPFVEAAMNALAETAMDLTEQDPAQAGVYRKAGFRMLWGGVARR